jgi:hypothetical protein
MLSSKNGKGVNGKSDPSFTAVVFMAFICAVLPLDISQLAFAVLGAVLYALLQRADGPATKKKTVQAVVETTPAQSAQRLKAGQPRAAPARTSISGMQSSKPVAETTPEVRAPSVQPIMAPTFQSDDWDGEVQELLNQITPTTEADHIVRQMAKMIRRTMQPVIPEIEVTGFANGNLTFGKAFGVAVPEVDIVASVSPQALYNRLHGRNSPSVPTELDEKKLQKSAIRSCTDRLVSAGGFKFRRSAFRGSEPKVTLLAPASLGLFSDSIPIDFSVNVVTPMYNAGLLMECGKFERRAKELILLVRRWAKDRGICHAAKGHLSPYMWSLLTIYFLQVGEREEGALLPSLELFELSNELLKGNRGVSNAPQQEKRRPAQEACEAKKPAAALFKDFVHFYQAEFDWRNEAVSIRAATRGPPSLDLPLHIIDSDNQGQSQVGPSIEDPFNKAQNLGDCMTAASLMRLKEELLRAETFCLRSASLSELLEPWVPANTPETEQAEEVALKAAPAKAAEATVAMPPWRRAAK